MLASSRKPILPVIQQHVEESAILRHTRSVLVDAAHGKLHHLARLDERIAAHLDGLALAGEYGSGLCETALEGPWTGEVFASAVGAIEAKEEGRLEKLDALAEAIPEARRWLISAFGWVSAQHLESIVSGLLGSVDPLRRLIGIAACTMHRVDPGAELAKAVSDPEPALRARALHWIMCLIARSEPTSSRTRPRWRFGVLAGDRRSGVQRAGGILLVVDSLVRAPKLTKVTA